MILISAKTKLTTYVIRVQIDLAAAQWSGFEVVFLGN